MTEYTFKIDPRTSGDIRITADISDYALTNLSYTKNEYKVLACCATFALTELGSTGSVQNFTINASNPPGQISGKLTELKYVPAFYESGEVHITFAVQDVMTADSTYDLVWDVKPYFAEEDMPGWYPYSCASDSKIMDAVVQSSQSDVAVSGSTEYTTHTESFMLKNWEGMMPCHKLFYEERDAKGNMIDTYARLCFPTWNFLVTCENRAAAACTLSFVKVEIRFGYYTNDVGMNIGRGQAIKDYAKLIPSPKYGDYSTPPNPAKPYRIFGILDGFDVDEVLAVYCQYYQYQEGQYKWFASVAPMKPLTDQGSNHPTLIWATDDSSIYNPFIDTTGSTGAPVDWERLAYNGPYTGAKGEKEYVYAITPQLLASDRKYRTIEVHEKDYRSENATTAVFVIETKDRNEHIEEDVPIEMITENMTKMKFYNVEMDFATVLEVKRTDIAPHFYETLQETYRNAPMLQSRKSEPLYYVNFAVNSGKVQSFGTDVFIPIYHGQAMSFSDGLRFASDGVASSDIFIFSTTEVNTIKMVDTKDTYKVNFILESDILNNCYVYREDDPLWSATT